MDRFFIAPYDKDSGLQNNVKPWLIPDTAFSIMNNAYVFRGRVRKRFGSQWMGDTALSSQLRVQIATLDGAGNTPAGTFVPLSGGIPIVTPAIGQAFSAGDQVFTVNALGTPANLLISGTATVATFNTTTGAVVINAGIAYANVALFYYPSLPVMGLLTYENNAFQNNFLIGFDTKFAYEYIGGSGWSRLSMETVAGDAQWSGTDTDFFWGTTWSGTNASDKVFFVTNNNKDEPRGMRRYITGGSWTQFQPAIDGTNFLISAAMIVVFKNRLVFLNTWEGPNAAGAIQYTNRARYSAIGSPLAANAFRTDLNNSANSIDAATTENIVGCEFLKDRLIVQFENSTWELVFTGNQAYPLSWQKINTELGSESTFSTVPFDKVVLAVGDTGIHACTGNNVERIDTLIPNEVFEILNGNDGVLRVYGIRDYPTEMVYWTFPDTQSNNNFPYPSCVLVYNYRNNTWSFNHDSITAFGYWKPTTGILWSSETTFWNSDTLWNSGYFQTAYPQVIGGNQEGFTFIINADTPINAAVLRITDVGMLGLNVQITSINHNLRPDYYVRISGCQWSDGGNWLNDTIYPLVLNDLSTPNTFLIDAVFSGTYEGGGLITLVSKIDIWTKQYNFYAKDGRNFMIPKIDFMVDATSAGQLEVNLYVSTAATPILQESQLNGTLIGTGNLDTFPYIPGNPGVVVPIEYERTADRLWHPVYFQADGEAVQFQLTLNEEQMTSNAVWQSQFQLHALCIHSRPTSSRLE